METIRPKARKCLTQTLKSNNELASLIEASIFAYSADNLDRYRDKLVQLLSNLDPSSVIKNTYLLPRVLEGKISPESLVTLTSMELFPDHWVVLEKEKKEIIEKVFETRKGITTDLFICYKCTRKHKKEIRECTYYTQQTRSADEPETIFVTCMRCNATWRE